MANHLYVRIDVALLCLGVGYVCHLFIVAKHKKAIKSRENIMRYLLSQMTEEDRQLVLLDLQLED